MILMVAGCDDKAPAGGDSGSAEEPTDSGGEEVPEVDADGDGYTIAGGDCDDTDPLIHPGAAEVCDGADNDCDGAVDDADDEVAGTPYYADADGDGYGDAARRSVACTPPGGYVANDTDCSDADGAVYPGAEEVCGDGRTNDCRTSDAEAAWACARRGILGIKSADASFIGEDAGDAAGAAVAGAGDMDGDGLDDLLIGAPGDEDGGVYLVFGSVGIGGIHDLSAASARFFEEDIENSEGSVLSGVGDINGDGFDDILVGAGRSSVGGVLAGSSYLVLGSARSALSVSDADAAFIGEDEYDTAGAAVSGAGDINGDGRADILIGASAYDDERGMVGRAYLILGSTSLSGTRSLSGADATFTGTDHRVSTGAALSGAGDIDGDGLSDLLVGAFGGGSGYAGRTSPGSVYLILGSTSISGDHSLPDADAIFIGEDSHNYAGRAVAGAGDIDGDGRDDILIGAIGNAEGGYAAGSAYLILGSTSLSGTMDLSGARARFIGAASLDQTGEAVSGAGDTNGDGLPDLLISAYTASDGAISAGKVYLILGSTGLSGTYSLSVADTALIGTEEGSYAGVAVAGVGDPDGDGLADFLIGASGAAEGGAAYLFLGLGR